MVPSRKFALIATSFLLHLSPLAATKLLFSSGSWLLQKYYINGLTSLTPFKSLDNQVDCWYINSDFFLSLFSFQVSNMNTEYLDSLLSHYPWLSPTCPSPTFLSSQISLLYFLLSFLYSFPPPFLLFFNPESAVAAACHVWKSSHSTLLWPLHSFLSLFHSHVS